VDAHYWSQSEEASSLPVADLALKTDLGCPAGSWSTLATILDQDRWIS